MLKKTITYSDLDGKSLTEDFYFNLSKAELAEFGLSRNGGFDTYLTKIVESENGDEIIAVFKKIISKSYGQRSEDGKSFIKSEKLSEWFMGTEAYSNLFYELITDPKASAEFINGVIPSDLAKMAEASSSTSVETLPSWVLEKRSPTRKEMMAMSQEQLLKYAMDNEAKKNNNED